MLRAFFILFAVGVLMGIFRFLASKAFGTALSGKKNTGKRSLLGAMFAMGMVACVFAIRPVGTDVTQGLLLFLACIAGYFGSLFWLIKQMRMN